MPHQGPVFQADLLAVMTSMLEMFSGRRKDRTGATGLQDIASFLLVR
ncbi:MAG: hypothetical protein M2R45_04685 [Verrucomicrobia subdivision 3 bacterium]|nr:hypothetical protein [Limisphaerales bacterium]MCS1416608.1 hypothetical protein [Limisphaerales bacterium]